jgi:N4-gp56 family major capsid protein
MARTIIGVNDPKAVKKWSGLLAHDVSHESYFNQRFMAKGATAKVPIQILTDLETDAGEQIAYDLLAELTMAPVEGDDNLEGKEEGQKFYTDQIYIDQARCGVNTGGRMTRKRTLHNLREKARMQQASWWARLQDELLFVYLSGARGINPNFLLPLAYTGRAQNALATPDSNHTLFGAELNAAGVEINGATSFATLDAADKFSLAIIDRAKARADTQGGGATGVPVLQPCKIDGEETFVAVMHPWQESDMRASTATGQWMDIQKAAAGAEGRKSPLFRGSLGMYRGVILHAHRNVIRFNNAGGGSNVEAARALFMGSQAAVCAWGSPGTGNRFQWNEEVRDNGNQVVITSSSIFGCKKVRFDMQGAVGQQDFGLFSLDTACAAR